MSSVLVLDGKKYLRMLPASKPPLQKCPHCGSDTFSTSGNVSFCNFCEQYVDFMVSQSGDDQVAEAVFALVQSQMHDGNWGQASIEADKLIKGNPNPRVLYLLGIFYRNFSTARYQQTNYNLNGFMEANAQSIKDSLDLTSKWKECFFKAVKIVNDELYKSVQADADWVLLKLMSEVRLKRFVDASITMSSLQTIDKSGARFEYALMAYSVEKNTKQAEASLSKPLGRNELNAYYYLAKYLAKHNKLDEAAAILQKLSAIANVSMAQELMHRVKLSQDAAIF